MNRQSKTDWDRIDMLSDDDIKKSIAADPDAAPELNDETELLPAERVVPEVVASYRAARGRQKSPRKVPVSIRLSPKVVEYFKTRGRGWQSAIDEVLVKYVEGKQ